MTQLAMSLGLMSAKMDCKKSVWRRNIQQVLREIKKKTIASGGKDIKPLTEEAVNCDFSSSAAEKTNSSAVKTLIGLLSIQTKAGAAKSTSLTENEACTTPLSMYGKLLLFSIMKSKQ